MTTPSAFAGTRAQRCMPTPLGRVAFRHGIFHERLSFWQPADNNLNTRPATLLITCIGAGRWERLASVVALSSTRGCFCLSQLHQPEDGVAPE